MADTDEVAPPELKDVDLFKSAMEPDKAPSPEPSPDPSERGQGVEPPSPSLSDGKVSPSDGGGGTPQDGAKDENIPSWRLREEAEARRVAEERASKAQRDLEVLVQAIQTEAQQQKETGQGPTPDDFFGDPRKSVETVVLEAIRPLIEQTRASQNALNRVLASQTHSVKAVEEAEAAFLEGVNKKTLDVTEYESVVQAPNRYDAVVRWHKRHKALAVVGDDPAAYFDKQLESKLADPAFQTQLLEKIRGAVGTAGTGSSVVKLPPSLSKSTSSARASNEDQGSMDDASLFAYARK
jgi:hypothetical protein